MENSPWIVILAGPNGAGKSTFYNKVLQEDSLLANIPFINMDNYAKELAGETGSTDDRLLLLKAGRRTRHMLEEKLANRENFFYETTASGRAHLRLMDEAKELGYRLGVIFIGLSDVELSHLRVKSRVEKGGHNVPSDAIERRFPNIVKRFPEMLKRSDIAAVFDNSSKNPYRLVFFMNETAIYSAGKYPSWVEEGLKGRKTSKTIYALSPETIKHLKEQQKELAKKVFSKRGRE